MPTPKSCLIKGSLLDLDSTNKELVIHRSEDDHVLAVGISVLRELLDHGLVFGARGREDIEVRQYRRAVDGYVEDSAPCRTPIGFGKVQPHRMARPNGKAGNRVSETRNACGWIHGNRRRVRHSAQINGVGMINGGAASEELVGNEWTHRRPAAVDLEGGGWQRGCAGLVGGWRCPGRIRSLYQIEVRSVCRQSGIRERRPAHTGGDLVAAGRREARGGAAENIVANRAARRRARSPAKIDLSAGSCRRPQPGWRGRYYRATTGTGNDFDPAYQRAVDQRVECDRVDAVGICVLCELLDHGFVLGARGGKDIEVAQYLSAVDEHVKGAGAGGREEGLGEVQPYLLTRAGSKARDDVAESPDARGLVHSHGRRVGHAAQINGIGVIDSCAATEILIGKERTHRRSAGVDRNVRNRRSGCDPR